MGFLDRILGRNSSDDRTFTQRYEPLPPTGGAAPTPGRGFGSAPYTGPQDRVPDRGPASGQASTPDATTDAARSQDEQAIARYRYLLETAPPEKIEQAHAEAFAKLTPQQRRQVLTELTQRSREQVADDSPATLARAATRLEMRRPGSLVGSSGGARGAVGLGIGGALLASVAGAFIGTAIAGQLLDQSGFGDLDGVGDLGGFGDMGGFGDVGGLFGDGGDFGEFEL